MSGEELYNLMMATQVKVSGPGLQVAYSNCSGETQIIFEAVAQTINQQQAGIALTPAALAITDDTIGALGWDEQQRLYERLFQIGHRIR